MKYFHHQSIRNYTIALLDLFNDIHIIRTNNLGEQQKDFIVPIQFGNKDKAFQLSKHDFENITNGNINILPRMALGFNGLSKAQERNTNKLIKINKSKINNSSVKWNYNSVAYDFDYTLYIATKTFTDATVIIEQIAPMFRPDITIKIIEVDIESEPTSIPVQIGDFSIELPNELINTEIRIVQIELPIILKGNLHLPIKENKLIKEIEVNINNIEKERKISSELYGLEKAIISVNNTETKIKEIL